MIDATSFWVPMRKSLGDKRREIPKERADEILRIFAEFKESDVSKIFPTTHFGFRKITVERPLRLNFQASLPSTLFKKREEFEQVLSIAAGDAEMKLSGPLKKAILSALSERDETAEMCRDAKGNPEPDPELRDTESVPLAEAVQAFFDREVKPHVPDAWIDMDKRDPKDGEVGLVGYEINFNRYFYKYTPPRPLEAIEADIRGIEQDILRMLKEVTGGA